MYYKNSKKNQIDLLETKKKIIELKKEMLYTKTLNDKLNDSDLMLPNNSNTFRSDDYYLTLNSNRTSKSVKFHDDDDDNSNNNNNDENDNTNNKQLDYLTNKATTDRYKKLTDFVNQTTFRSENFKFTDTLNLSLPITPRITEVTASSTSNVELRKQFKSLEALNETSSLKFIQEYTELLLFYLFFFLLNKLSFILVLIKIILNICIFIH